MSDPMTNTEVEDVLASIRRLVSDDKRPETQPVQKVPTDRLVLTPSLRVMTDSTKDEDEATAEPAPDVKDGDDALTAFAAAAFALPQDDRVDEEKTDVSAPSLDDADAGDARLDAHAEAIADELDVMDDAHAEPDDSGDVLVLDGDDSAQAEGEWPADADKDEDEDGDDATPPADPSDDNETEARDAVAEDILPEDWAETDDPAIEDAAAPDTAEDTPAQDIEDVAEPVAQTLSEKIAALETLVGKRADHFEPDDPGADAYAGTDAPAMEWEDADEAPAFAAYVEAKPAHEQEPPAQQLFSSDEDVLDEEALRELVSDIVREELQGALGERITRNVRKLVRREIHRALAAQELE